jgi:hypothetical protein
MQAMILNGVSAVLLSHAFVPGVTRKRSAPEYLSIFAGPHRSRGLPRTDTATLVGFMHLCDP